MNAPIIGQAKPEVAILHYTAPPIIGGVEAVIQAHVQAFLEAGYPTTVIAGRGSADVLPPGAVFHPIPGMDTQAPRILQASQKLDQGEVPDEFDDLVSELFNALEPAAGRFDRVIVHNIFTKHFNLPLTAALARLIEAGTVRGCIAWCHDLSWTSPNSRSKVHPGYPWDLLRTPLAQVVYVAVSEERARGLSGLFGTSAEAVRVIYNGVNPRELLGLSPEGWKLVEQLDLLESDLVLLSPVRITQAKNIEFAIQVAGELKSRGLRVKLVVTGPPDPHDAGSMAYFGSLQDLRRELGVEQELRFVFESSPDPEKPYFIPYSAVADLFRVSDVVFMPSHREGFGMPVLEAGMVGVPVVCTDIPAAREIGGDDVTRIDASRGPESTAEQILELVDRSPAQRLRRRVRQRFTWKAIFNRDIEPLLRNPGRY